MPRIPLRTEPYSSPARQQRHYKSKRDRTLKALGSASHINGSQFAIILVNAKGDVETYASELFKVKLPAWFDEAVKTEARQILLNDKTARANQPQASGPPLVEVELAPDSGEVYRVSSDVLAMTPPFEVPPSAAHATPTKPRPTPPQLSPIDPDLANQLYKPSGEDAELLTPTSLPSLTPSTSETLTSFSSGMTASALDEWFCNKFHCLQQTTCKLVAKCWIKVIEPKKQNKYPYQKGEESKPEWWPENIRHKEPDHLLKHERNTLLLAILNSGRAPIARLELSTAEAMAHIQPDKFAILREIYDMAKEQELRRIDPNYKPRAPLTVVAVPPRMASPFDDTTDNEVSTPATALGKHPRSADENATHVDRLPRQSRRIVLTSPARGHTMTRADSLPTLRDFPATCSTRRHHRASFVPSPQHSIPFSASTTPFAFAVQSSLPNMISPNTFSHQEELALSQVWAAENIPQYHLPPPAPSRAATMYNFADTSSSEQYTSSAAYDDVAQSVARRVSMPLQPSLLDPVDTLPPPSPNSIAMMMWAQGLPGPSSGVSDPEPLPSPSYPISAIEFARQHSWTTDFHVPDKNTASADIPGTPPLKTNPSDDE
ncbi:hypothetical protein FRB99_001195, partial [Tulasnella sp. 403]